jgi:hypothetical protein
VPIETLRLDVRGETRGQEELPRSLRGDERRERDDASPLRKAGRVSVTRRTERTFRSVPISRAIRMSSEALIPAA